MAQDGLEERRIAKALVDRVTIDQKLLSDALPGAVRGQPPEVQARVQRLALATLRHAGRADRVLGRFLRNMPELPVMNILRLATVEMLEEGAAPHGVINAAVEMAQAHGRKAGLANAVLRKVADVAPEDWAALVPGRLPNDLRKPLVAAYGGKAVTAIEAVMAQVPPVDVTLKDPAAPSPFGDEAKKLPMGNFRLSSPGQVSALPGYDAGDWWVQDAAAALPALVLHPAAGERIADICAAPGGKTLQLAAAGADVTAVDQSEARMARVAENLKRTGLSATLVVADALTWTPEAPFDAVLVDAPCSATGTLRRHPDLPFAKAGRDVAPLLPLQAGLIDKAVAMLRPGGRLVYCVCSLLPEEGEAQAEAALARHPDLVPDGAATSLPGLPQDWRQGHTIRTRPDFWAEIGGIDGFFIAAFRKSA